MMNPMGEGGPRNGSGLWKMVSTAWRQRGRDILSAGGRLHLDLLEQGTGTGPKVRNMDPLLKRITKDTIINDVFRSALAEKKPGEIYWQVLVLDHFSSKILSHCCGMRDIAAEGITLVEDLHKRREPLPFLEATYLLKPSDEKSIEALLKDLNSVPNIYKAFNIFFVELCPEEIMRKLGEVLHIGRIKALKEVNMSFIPYESHVFLTEKIPNINQAYYQSSDTNANHNEIKIVARQIASLCISLGEYPSIRYRSAYPKNEQLADIVHQHLKEYKKLDEKLGESPEKSQSQLIILDRGFDCASPLLHELTFEAMVHDVLPLEDGAYKLKEGNGNEKPVFLDSVEKNWTELKHLHIADVMRKVSEDFKNFAKERSIDKPNEKVGVRDLQMMVKKLPQFQKEITLLATHMSMAEDCWRIYGRIKHLCELEQELVTGEDENGEKVKDVMSRMNPLLLEVDQDNVTVNEKLRLIALYVISRSFGVSSESLSKLFVHAILDSTLIGTIDNMMLLGPNALPGTGKKEFVVDRKCKEKGGKAYKGTRWTPLLKDIVEHALEQTLDNKNFPNKGNINTDKYKVPSSTRYMQQWYPRGGNAVRNVPRIIVFVVGGISLSEIRSVYEINRKQTEWDVIIGSTEILTPDTFLENLSNLTSE